MAPPETSSRLPSCDAYFDAIQLKKKLPYSLQECLTSAFAGIPVSSFPEVPGGKVIEIPGDTPIVEAVRILSEHNIMTAPVIRNTDGESSTDWRDRYLGIIDYAAVILWVLVNVELTTIALSASSATTAGVGEGASGPIGAAALGATGSAAVSGLTIAVGAAVGGDVAIEKGTGKDSLSTDQHLGDNFYKVLREEPFGSTTVKSIMESYRWSPFLPVGLESSMLIVMLLLSKYRLRSIPVVESGKSHVKNFITQTAVVRGLQQCGGRDWFDCIAAYSLSDLGLPFMSSEEVISIKGDDLVLEAFKRMKENHIGGLPVIQGPRRKIIGSINIRDIRVLLLKPDLLTNFGHLTVMDFLKNLESVAEQPVTCSPNASLGSVIDRLASKSVHRIYVVEEEESEIVGVITLRDVISCFIFEPRYVIDKYFGCALKELQSR
ncbi:SNF1-related protein kinase regulatory subunit gamma-1-like [Zingiber officinale]|uniref:SNF1-related protein kinase regulatory subunit gamma-1-like n=1 Tax=Zingiber officinale TaxID=94328 RepID=UPI001C4C1FFE|nr:SNF1-related protein kinase regulatory subunit gamma-1-like [Zingiber officinale]XP_042383308.1 SNF1-related protein kinase regulatory subunit gamma-1-like [Zingiber officinale]